MNDCEKLGLLRAYSFAVGVIYVLMIPLQSFSVFPIELHEPVGVARLIPEVVWPALHDRSILLALRGLLAFGLLFCALGLRGYRYIAPVTIGLLLLQQVLIRIDRSGHDGLILLLCLTVLAAFPAADAFALGSRNAPQRKPKGIYQAALLLVAFTFLFTYVAPALYRLVHAAPTIFMDGSMARYTLVNGSSLRNSNFGFEFGAELVSTGPIAVQALNVGFAIATLLEAFAFLCLVNRPFRFFWLGFALVFHALNFLLLNIDFMVNMLLAPAVLLALEPHLFSSRASRRTQDNAVSAKPVT